MFIRRNVFLSLYETARDIWARTEFAFLAALAHCRDGLKQNCAQCLIPSYGKVFPPLELLSYSQWILINQMELDLVPDYLIAIWSLATNGLRDYQLATTATSQARYLSTIFGPQASSSFVTFFSSS